MEKIMEFLKTQGIEWYGTTQLKDSLTAMGKGMLGIFIVIAMIVLVTVLLNHFTASKENDGEEEDNKE